jgi:hypothetical protein
VIVGSVAPRKLIHAHEFSWDRERDPVWMRYQRIWGLYDAAEGLAFTQGFGTIQNTSAPASHCNNIGAEHRKLIHEALRKWFAIDVKPEDEYKSRRTREELTCLTDEAKRQFQPKALHVILGEMADKQLAAVRDARAKAMPEERRKLAREAWTRLLGDTTPPAGNVREEPPAVEKIGPVNVTRELIETEPGIKVRVLTLAPAKKSDVSMPLILGVASDGIEPILQRQRDNLAAGLKAGMTIVLVEVRGTGAGNPEEHRGQQSGATSHAATSLMLGRPLSSGQLRDLRTVWQRVRQRDPAAAKGAVVIGGAGVMPLDPNAEVAYPRRIDGRPAECRPTGALLAALMALYEDDFASVTTRRGLVAYRSVLDSQFVQVPHEAIVPGLLREGDLTDLFDALSPRGVEIEELVDGRGRLVPPNR